MSRRFKIGLHSFLVCLISFLPLGIVSGESGSLVQHNTAHLSQSSSLHFDIAVKQGVNTQQIFFQQSTHECGALHCDFDCECGNCFKAINGSPSLHNRPDMPHVLVLAVLITDSSGFTPPFRPPRT